MFKARYQWKCNKDVQTKLSISFFDVKRYDVNIVEQWIDCRSQLDLLGDSTLLSACKTHMLENKTVQDKYGLNRRKDLRTMCLN